MARARAAGMAALVQVLATCAGHARAPGAATAPTGLIGIMAEDIQSGDFMLVEMSLGGLVTRQTRLNTSLGSTVPSCIVYAPPRARGEEGVGVGVVKYVGLTWDLATHVTTVSAATGATLQTTTVQNVAAESMLIDGVSGAVWVTMFKQGSQQGEGRGGARSSSSSSASASAAPGDGGNHVYELTADGSLVSQVWLPNIVVEIGMGAIDSATHSIFLVCRDDGAPSGLSLAHIDVRGKAVLSNAPLAEVVQVLLWAGGGAARSAGGMSAGTLLAWCQRGTPQQPSSALVALDPVSRGLPPPVVHAAGVEARGGCGPRRRGAAAAWGCCELPCFVLPCIGATPRGGRR